MLNKIPNYLAAIKQNTNVCNFNSLLAFRLTITRYATHLLSPAEFLYSYLLHTVIHYALYIYIFKSEPRFRHHDFHVLRQGKIFL